MPRPARNVLKRHADEMGQTHAVGFGLDPLTLASLFLGLLQIVVRCWFSGPTQGAAKAGRSSLRDEHDGSSYSPRVVKKLRQRVRRHFRGEGIELSEEQVASIADDVLERQRKASDDDVASACEEGWTAI